VCSFLVLAALLIVGISIFGPGLRGAPWVPTPMHLVHRMLAMAEVAPGDVVYDLGCGDGRLILAAAQDYGARAVGVEIDLLRYLWCRRRIIALGLQDRVQVIRGDLFEQDLSDADVVTCYLLQTTNDRLEGKLERELEPGARVVSHSFTFPGLHLVGEDGQYKLFAYRIDATHSQTTKVPS
jgi:SAM-dependent methyltransferase